MKKREEKKREEKRRKGKRNEKQRKENKRNKEGRSACVSTTFLHLKLEVVASKRVRKSIEKAEKKKINKMSEVERETNRYL